METPPIPPALLTYLTEVFPDRAPEREALRDPILLAFHAGQVDVVRFLKDAARCQGYRT